MNVRTVEIRKVAAPELQGYPRNGNFDSQAMVYRWQVVVNGKVMASERTLTKARIGATHYTAARVKVIR